MSGLAPPPGPEKDPERKPEPSPDRPAFKLLPEFADQLRHLPAPKHEPPRPEPERKANTKDLEHRPPEPDPRNRPTIQMPGMGSSYVRPPPVKSAEPTPEPRPEPEKRSEPVPDILAEARRRLAERGQLEQAQERPSGRVLELRKPDDGREL